MTRKSVGLWICIHHLAIAHNGNRSLRPAGGGQEVGDINL
jgi:hypothetical protein